ncbi:hypothetical protein PFZ79_002008 [Enterococcus hirae]|nr:hypothetical protein [Enterococcus hirae]
MNFLNLTSLIVSNLGGTLAIINTIWTIYSRRAKLDCKLTNVFNNKRGFILIRLSIINRSNRPISFHDIRLAYTKSRNHGVFNTSKDKVYIMQKRYDNYSYPLFTDQLPITLPPKGATSLLLEVFDNPNIDNIGWIRILTESKTIKTELNKELKKEINLYQLR